MTENVADRLAFHRLLDVAYANGVRPEEITVVVQYGHRANVVTTRLSSVRQIERPTWLPAEYPWQGVCSDIVLCELCEIGGAGDDSPTLLEATTAAWKTWGQYVWWLRLWRDAVEAQEKARKGGAK